MTPTDAQAYAHFRPALAQAIDARLYDLKHLDEVMARGEANIWWTFGSAIVAEVRIYPTGAKVLHGLVATGLVDQIVNDLIPAAESWAKAQGCIMAIIESRPAWAKLLKRHGYEPHQLAVRKEL